MFTGIVTGVGEIVHIENLGNDLSFGKRLLVQAPIGYLDDVGIGDSIALNGACVTVTTINANRHQFTIDISAESLSKTAGLDQMTKINLEKALRSSDRLGGHIVTGHVDGCGVVSRIAQSGESWELKVMCPTALGAFLATKGSVTINGVSLTINAVADTPQGCEISVNLIPHTMTSTALSELTQGYPVNLEVDVIARYVKRMLQAHSLTD